MPLVINSNIASLNAQRNLSNSQAMSATSMQRLSSGLRINSAKDDAAGLAISNRLTSQVNGLNQAIRNANDGISVAQTAEGALDETNTILQRIRTLAVQSANDSYSASDREYMQAEVDELLLEVDRIASSTKFGSQELLDGTYSGKQFQVGADNGETVTVSIGSSSTGALGVSGLGVGTATSAGLTIASVDLALASLNEDRADLGAIQSRLESVVRNLSNVSENAAAANSRVLDADFAAETANMAKSQILTQAGISVLAQANAQPQNVLALLQ